MLIGSNKGILTSTEWKRIVIENKNKNMKLPAFTLWNSVWTWCEFLPCWSYGRLLHHSNFFTFSLEICLRLCVLLRFSKHTTIYHLFPPSYPLNVLVCGKPQHCWLAVFCLLAALLLLYSPRVIYLLIRPLPYSFHHLHWRPCITTEKQYYYFFFPNFHLRFGKKPQCS